MGTSWRDGVCISDGTSVRSRAQARQLLLRRAEQLANRLIHRRGHDTPPFLPSEYAPLLGIKKIEVTHLGKMSALLLPFSDSYEIKLNAADPETRRNFSCAHEIGHILFSELGLRDYVKGIEYRTYDPQASVAMRAGVMERLCDFAAVQLIMPAHVFKRYLHLLGLGVHAIKPLADLFRVSARAAAIRMAEVAAEQCIVILWQPWPKRGRVRGLKVSLVRSDPERAPHRPVVNLARLDSSLYKAYTADVTVRSSRAFVAAGATRRVSTESKGFGHDEHRYVVSLAFPERSAGAKVRGRTGEDRV